MNEVIKTINERVSLRKYENKKISKDHLDIILNSSMRAPTAGNMMLYSILTIESEDTKKKLSISCDNQPFIAKAPLILIFLADFHRTYRYFDISKVKDYCIKNNKKYRHPSEGDLFLAINDAIIAAQNAVISAESLGIGSCYIGDIMENYEFHKELLNLPNYTFPICMLTLGYYPQDTKKIYRKRFDKKYTVYSEKYADLSDNDIKECYKEWDKSFMANNPYNGENTGQILYARKTGGDFSLEMTRSVREALKKWNEEI